MKRYCLDTNVFIQGWNKYYSMNLCPSYWEILDQLAHDNKVFSPIEVKREIEKTDDKLAEWIKTRPHLFIDITPEIQTHLREIMSSHQRLVDSTKQRSIADPWVIASAIAENAVVVTKETPAGLSSKRIKIPDVCQAMRVPWMNDFQFVEQIGIRFDAAIS